MCDDSTAVVGVDDCAVRQHMCVCVWGGVLHIYTHMHMHIHIFICTYAYMQVRLLTWDNIDLVSISTPTWITFVVMLVLLDFLSFCGGAAWGWRR